MRRVEILVLYRTVKKTGEVFGVVHLSMGISENVKCSVIGLYKGRFW